MTPHTRSRLIAGATALLASTGLVAGSALPATAATGSHPAVMTYVALGDSYAAGQATDCTHPASSYPMQLDALLQRVKLIRDAACAGATTSDVVDAQLGSLNPGVRLVTVTVGANDLDVAGLTALCAPVEFPPPSPSPACLAALGQAQSKLETLGAALPGTYRAIAAAAPRAEILVTGYPPLVSSEYPATEQFAAAEAALNGTIEAAVAWTASQGVNIRYVPVSFAGHTIDHPADSWFELSGANMFHPNAAGNRAIADDIAAALD